MRRLIALVLVGLAASALAQIPYTGEGDQIEGPNIPWLQDTATCFNNCDPKPGQEFAECVAMVDVQAARRGLFKCATRCRNFSYEPLLPLPNDWDVGDWWQGVADSMCEYEVGLGANCGVYPEVRVYRGRSYIQFTHDQGCWTP